MIPIYIIFILYLSTTKDKGGKEECSLCPKFNHIKDLSNCGYRISEISKKTGTDPKTIRKYLAQDDFSPQPPVIQEKPSKLDPFKPIIQEWLDEDKKHWRKQHHTAQRVYERLVAEHGYTGSYSIVQRYMKKCRSIQTEKQNLELIWGSRTCTSRFRGSRLL